LLTYYLLKFILITTHIIILIWTIPSNKSFIRTIYYCWVQLIIIHVTHIITESPITHENFEINCNIPDEIYSFLNSLSNLVEVLTYQFHHHLKTHKSRRDNISETRKGRVSISRKTSLIKSENNKVFENISFT